MSVSDGPKSDESPQEEPSYNADRSLATPQKTPLMEQLPLELLLEIFAHFDVAESWHPFFGCVRGSGLAKLMLVCRDWYTLVCTTPEFWRIIDTTEPAEVISLYLQRSCGCMIDVFVSLSVQSDVYPPYDLDRDANAISLVMPYASRIRSLSVDLSSDHFRLVQPLFEAGLPALQNISIMPEKQPYLRSLVARNVYLPPVSAFWHSLRVLKLYGFPESLSGAMSAQDVLEILQTNNTLEEVHLLASDYVPHTVTPDQPSFLRTPLKISCLNLRVFVLHGPLWLTTDLLSELRFQEDIPHVDIRILSPIDCLERAFSSAIPRHFRFLLERMSDVSFQTNPAYGQSPSPYQLKLTSPSRRATRIATERGVTSISFEYHYGLPDAPDLPDTSLPLRCLTRVLQWTTVRHLKLVQLPQTTEADTYEGLFDSFPSLESLAICPFSLARTRGVLVALQPARRESDGHLDVPRCPHLRMLAIHEGTADTSGQYELLDALIDCVRVRAESGSRLDEVDVHLYCYTYRHLGLHEARERRVLEAVERMRGHVGGVVWKYGWDATCEGCGG